MTTNSNATIIVNGGAPFWVGVAEKNTITIQVLESPHLQWTLQVPIGAGPDALFTEHEAAAQRVSASSGVSVKVDTAEQPPATRSYRIQVRPGVESWKVTFPEVRSGTEPGSAVLTLVADAAPERKQQLMVLKRARGATPPAPTPDPASVPSEPPRAPGADWNSFQVEHDREPTLLIQAPDRLYGVFRRRGEPDEQAVLLQSSAPDTRWDPLETSVQGAPAGLRIPEGFATSPGAYCGERAWLLGGSQIDPDVMSNEVWCIRPGASPAVWERQPDAAWQPRMGHAVLEYDGKLWVMGGCDAAGNALADVWTLNPANGKWTCVHERAWPGRCMFSPVVFRDAIYLYGGVEVPFARQQLSDAHRYVKGRAEWEQIEGFGTFESLEGGAPFACCLYVVDDQLGLFAKCLSPAANDGSKRVSAVSYVTPDPITPTWDPLDTRGLEEWGDQRTFSLQIINFRERWLVGKALAQAPNSAKARRIKVCLLEVRRS